VTKAFTPKAVAGLEPFVRQIVNDLLDGWGQRTSIEFVAEFAVPLPVKAIATMLGVPEERYPDVKRWSDAFIAGIGTIQTTEERVVSERTVNEFQHFFAAELERRRAQSTDDLLTQLLHARIDEPGVDPRPLDVPEILSILSQLMTAGNETTTKLLSEAMRLLGEQPGEWRALRNDPTRADRVVEEALRLSSPTQGMFRRVRRDTELGGVTLPKGSMLIVVFGAANRDTDVFGDDAESFVPDRANAREHLAFGKGVHFCLGAALTRLEARVALEELARRVPAFELADENDFAYFPSILLRGLRSLHLQLQQPVAL
jgi:cytochrome P450